MPEDENAAAEAEDAEKGKLRLSKKCLKIIIVALECNNGWYFHFFKHHVSFLES